jgi:hypothetical protein
MMGFLRRRGPTAIAVTLAFLAGGGAAVTAQNLITSADIKDGTIKAADIANGAVNSNKLANQSVANADLANNAVGSAKISDGAVATADIANGAVNSNKLVNGGVANADLANNAVGSAKISDGAVSSADIANGGVANADLANNAVNSAKVADNTITSGDIANGTIATGDLSTGAIADLTEFSGGNWGVVDRNVIGNGDSYLRSGPVGGDIPDIPAISPPLGVGSLGLRTGSDTDKAAFGNQISFIGDPVSGLTAVSASIYTTQENIDVAANNLPNIAFEIDAKLDAVPGAIDFSTMVYVPPDQVAPGWRVANAVTEGLWGLTGQAGVETGCDLNLTLCSFADLMTALNDGGDPAVIFTVQITKGSDHPYSGAVDALRINDTVYDFEPNGVFETPAAP